MKHIKLIASFIMIASILSSCLTSINPLITYKNIKSFDNCVGTWDNKGTQINIEKFMGSELQKVMFKESDISKMDRNEAVVASSAYIAGFTKNGIRHFMGIQFTNFNGEWLAQFEPIIALQSISPTEPRFDSTSKDLWSSKSGTYSFARVISSNPGSLSFAFIDSEKVFNMLKQGSIAMKYEFNELFGTKYITATSDELEKFFKKYGRDDRLFDKTHTLILNRVHL